MRILVATVAVVLLSACSASDESESKRPEAETSSVEKTDDSPSGSTGPCDLLTTEEAELLVGTPTAEPRLDPTSEVPTCEWEVKPKGMISVMSMDATEWAQTLPEILASSSSLKLGAEDLQQLEDAAELIETGRDVTPEKACSLFSDMLELQGQRPGTIGIVSAGPSREDAKYLNAQVCTEGRFTSLVVAKVGGFSAPFPDKTVQAIAFNANKRSAG